MPNVVEFPNPPTHMPFGTFEISVEDFCLADEGRLWMKRDFVRNTTILMFPGIMLICGGGGECTAVSRDGVGLEVCFPSASEAIAV